MKKNFIFYYNKQEKNNIKFFQKKTYNKNMFRNKTSKSQDKKVFTRTAKKVKQANYKITNQRGGFHL
jgi:hypothetical protein